MFKGIQDVGRGSANQTSKSFPGQVHQIYTWIGKIQGY